MTWSARQSSRDERTTLRKKVQRIWSGRSLKQYCYQYGVTVQNNGPGGARQNLLLLLQLLPKLFIVFRRNGILLVVYVGVYYMLCLWGTCCCQKGHHCQYSLRESLWKYSEQAPSLLCRFSFFCSCGGVFVCSCVRVFVFSFFRVFVFSFFRFFRFFVCPFIRLFALPSFTTSATGREPGASWWSRKSFGSGAGARG